MVCGIHLCIACGFFDLWWCLCLVGKKSWQRGADPDGGAEQAKSIGVFESVAWVDELRDFLALHDVLVSDSEINTKKGRLKSRVC